MDVKWHSPCEKLMKNKMVGTAINMLITSITAYALSKKYLPGRKVMMGVVIVFMLFNPGMIPNYLVVNDLHMLDTYWSLWLPIAISAYNMVIMKNFFQGLPDSIEESAQIDGCNDLQVFLRIVVPISKASFATITLFYAVSHWNSYFNAMMYLNDINDWPIQVWLRQIIVLSVAASRAPRACPSMRRCRPTRSNTRSSASALFPSSSYIPSCRNTLPKEPCWGR